MDFLSVLFGIILGFAAHRGAAPEDQMRLNMVAQNMWDAAQESETKPFAGEAASEATALALASVAGHESGFWSKVQDCSICYPGSPFCDKGRSISLYQFHVGSGAWRGYTRQEICGSNVIATGLALRILNRHAKANHPLGLFRGYARGGRAQAAWEMHQMFAYATRKADIVVSYRDGHMQASWGRRHKGSAADLLSRLQPPAGVSLALLPGSDTPRSEPRL